MVKEIEYQVLGKINMIREIDDTFIKAQDLEAVMRYMNDVIHEFNRTLNDYDRRVICLNSRYDDFKEELHELEHALFLSKLFNGILIVAFGALSICVALN